LSTEKLNDESVGLLLLVYLFSIKDDLEASKILYNFEQEILYNNRYFPDDSKISNAIKTFACSVSLSLPEGTKINRARSISYSKLPQKTKEILDKLKYLSGNLFPNMHYKVFSELLNDIKEIINNPEFKDNINNIDPELINKIKKPDFWGFVDKESDAPPCDKATAGRANPNGISYLYAAENAHTAIVEARPIIGQVMSVAEIEITKPLTLFDFCSVNKLSDDTKIEELSLLRKIAEYFSTPNYVKEQGYLLTQYIAEMLKKEFNFNGIRFQSSLHREGKNIVLFNEHNNSNEEQKEYIINHSSLHIIENISVCEYRAIPI